MLDNPLKRESVKAMGATAALISGNLIAASLAIALGVAVEALGLLGEKRTKELFDSEQLAGKVISKVKQSDDFASFVFSVWQKHNFESSQERRRMLKKFLEKEANTNDNHFENFSKLENIMQNANLRAIRLLSIIHSDTVQKRRIDPDDDSDRMLSLQKLVPLVQSVINMHEQDIEYFMNELGSYGLVSTLYGRYGGTFYNHAKLGYVLLEYIQD